jgi:hypothetical protein
MEDDWSFIIKTQALLETALAYLIKTALGREELETFIEKLNLNGRTGKISLVKALGLLTDDQRRYLEQLAGLRNNVAHKIQYVTFTLAEHLKCLSDNDFKKFVLTALIMPDDTPFTVTAELREKMLPHSRTLLWAGALNCLMAVYFHDQKAEEERLRTEFYKNFYESKSSLEQGLAGLFPMRLSDLAYPNKLRGLLDPAAAEGHPFEGTTKEAL